MAERIREEDSGAVVWQVTDDALPKSNIYCELPYCSADSTFFVFERRASEGFTPERGNLLGVRAGAPARVVSKGYAFLHVGTSTRGEFFCCDARPGGEVIVGSVRTGRNAFVCRSESSFGRAQHTHPHPYLSPDLRWVVFNSDRSGETQIHVASVPSELLERLRND